MGFPFLLSSFISPYRIIFSLYPLCERYFILSFLFYFLIYSELLQHFFAEKKSEKDEETVNNQKKTKLSASKIKPFSHSFPPKNNMGVIINMSNEQHHCQQESRIAALEAKLDNKKETIHELNDDYRYLREKLDTIALSVTELTVVMKETTQRRDEEEHKIESLQLQVKELSQTINTLKWVIGVGVPVVCTVLTFIIQFLF